MCEPVPRHWRLEYIATWTFLGTIFGGNPIFAQADKPETIVPRSGLFLQRVDRTGVGVSRDMLRGRVRFDDPLADLIVRTGLRDFHPESGQQLRGGDGSTYVWSTVELDESGAAPRQGFRRGGGYLYIPIESHRERVMILEASGQSIAYFNGQPRAGNIYRRDYFDLPVLMREGTNNLLLRTGRGQFAARLYSPPAPVTIQSGDMTLPDLVVGEPTDTWGSAVVLNATQEPVGGGEFAWAQPVIEKLE